MPKKSMPRDVAQAALYIVRGQPARRQRYASKYAAIMADAKIAPGGNTAEGLRAWESVIEGRLVMLEREPETETMRAVDAAAGSIGEGLRAELRDKLRAAVLLNCKDGRRWRYEVLDVPTISRAEFYRRKRAFLRDVAEKCGIW